jgi:succinate dehydrogenase / fumarate reductase, cytochrome b subunit
MNWFLNTLGSSIGKKLLMAATGLCFIGFLTVHLAGNLTLYGGQELFNAYAEHLHALGPVVTVAEWGLLTLALIHVVVGLTLFYQNLQARVTRYQVSRWAGGRTVGSATMPYTGAVILAFVVMHLFNFHFVDKETTSIFEIVAAAFNDPILVFMYVAAMAVVAIHVSHGFWSLFQTIGANHPKYMPAIRILGLCLSLAFGIGFGFIPVFISFMA